jgi:3-oxoacyl-[acyl-carrier protein] reductase
MGHYIIVGGSKGIGRGLVDRLLSDGHSITVLARTPEGLDTTDRVQFHPFDVTQDEVQEDWLAPEISGLAYCPGSINLRAFRSLKPEMFRSDFELNVVGAVRLIQASITKLQANPTPSSILLFSTVAVSQGMFAHASIAAAKGAIEGLTRTLASELAPKVRVNCIAPALTQTAMTEKFFADPDKAKALGEKYPMLRTGTVDDIASLGHFLLSDRSNWITGQVIGVDGGMSTLKK